MGARPVQAAATAGEVLVLPGPRAFHEVRHRHKAAPAVLPVQHGDAVRAHHTGGAAGVLHAARERRESTAIVTMSGGEKVRLVSLCMAERKYG